MSLSNGSSCFALLVAALAWAVTFAAGTFPSAAAETVDPSEFGLKIPAGAVRAGSDERAITNDEDGKPVVAKVHAQVGENYVVLLPDGALVARAAAETAATDRPFVAASKDDIAARLLAGKLKDFKTKQTGRYLFVYNTSETFAETASRILETMHNGIELHAKAQKIEIRKPVVPLIVVMFATEDEFQQHCSLPDGVVAYYDSLSNRVVLYEKTEHPGIKPELVVRQTLATIAHEGTHQILHNIGVQQRLSVWPLWLAEGLAEYFAPTTTDTRMQWKGAGQVNDMRMFELESYLKSRAADGLDGKTIEQTVLAARLSSAGYASAWSLTHYLARSPGHRAKFNELVKQMSELGPFQTMGRVERPGIVRENLRVFKELFGDDLAALEKRLVAYLQKLPYTPPFAEFPHYVAMIALRSDKVVNRSANMFYSSELAENWLRETLGALSDDQRASAETKVHECKNRAEAIAFTRFWLSSR